MLLRGVVGKFEMADTGNQEKPSVQKTAAPVKSGGLSFFNSLPPRLLVLWLIVFVVSYLAAVKAFEFVQQQIYLSNTNAVVGRLSKEKVSNATLNSMRISQGLAWLYTTDESGKPDAGAASMPAGLQSGKESRAVTIGGNTFFENVAELEKGHQLHLGYSVPMMPSTNFQSSELARTVPLGFGALWLAIAGVLTSFFLFRWISVPARKFASLGDRILNVAGDERESLFAQNRSISEIENFITALRLVCSKLDEEKFERLSREHELKKQKIVLQQVNERLQQDLQEHQFQSHKSISELSFKESEEALLKLIDSEISSCKNAAQICQKALDRLSDKYPTSIKYACFFLPKGDRVKFEGHIGLDDNSLMVLRNVSHDDLAADLFHKGASALLSEGDLARYDMADLSNKLGWKTAIYVPISFADRSLALMAVYFDEQTKSSAKDRHRLLKNIADLLARTIHKVVLLAEELASARTDSLTGLYNKKFFQEFMPNLLLRAKNHHPVSILMVDGDHFKDINDTYGHQVGDKMLVEFSNLMKANTRHGEEKKTGRFKDYVIRWGGEEFLLVLDNTDRDTAAMVAERLRRKVAEKSDWPGGIAKWTISVGFVTTPGDGDDLDELLKKADTALYYCKRELGRNKVVHYSDIPKSFKSKGFSNLEGELGVFDTPALLQSLATAQKTGVLTVAAPDGRNFWLLVELGRPVQARLGRLGGTSAVIEFISNFDEGKFNFLEKTETKARKILDDSYDVDRGLERCLMAGALAADNLSWGRGVLTEGDVPLKLVETEELSRCLKVMEEATDIVSPEDMSLVSIVIGNLEFGSTSLNELVDRIGCYPTADVWRTAALMIQYQLVKTVSQFNLEKMTL